MLRLLCLLAVLAVVTEQQDVEPAVRVVRFQVDYKNASTNDIIRINKWQSIMRNSVIASLRFINKHWLICGGGEADKKANDCGKAQVTGEILGDRHYRINITFIGERDPIRNAKVDATSTVLGVAQIGLRGGIFQYTNALKVLGKPEPELPYDEAYFCYRGAQLVGDTCRACAVGSEFDDVQNTCVPCEKGFYGGGGGYRCELCEMGRTTEGAGARTKQECIPICPAGYFFDAASHLCEPCGLRGFQPMPGSARCLPCPHNTVPFYRNSTQVDHCLEKCPAGRERSADGSTCQPCPLGSFRASEDPVCLRCPPGKSTYVTGATRLAECIVPRCPPGEHLDEFSLQCEPCALGFYQENPDARQCERCPSGTLTYKQGASKRSECQSTDQCASGRHDCHWLAACFDLPDEGGEKRFACRCRPGFIGNGQHCADICDGLCGNGGSCIRTNDKARCECSPGFTGRRCEIAHRRVVFL